MGVSMKGTTEINVGRRFIAVILLATMVALVTGSIWVWLYVNQSVEEQRKGELTRVADNAADEAVTTMSELTERLFGLRGFVTGENVNYLEWRRYISAVGIEQRFPGVYSFAYAPLIKRIDLDRYLEVTRGEEADPLFKNYTVFPVSENAELFPLRYISTTDADLGKLLGYDLGTSENSVMAIKDAVFGDVPAITNLLHLGLVIPGNTKTGYIVMLPVYSRADIDEFPKEQKKKYLQGLVGAWIFPDGIMSNEEKSEIIDTGNVRLSVYDGADLLFTIGGKGKDIRGLRESREVTILNKKLRFDFAATKSTMLSSFTESLPLTIAAGLIVINLMWATTITFILLSRRRAVRLAENATKDLRKFKQAVEGVSDQVVITDPEGTIIYANQAAETMTGFKRDFMIGKKTTLWANQMKDSFYKKLWKTVREEKKSFWGEIYNKKKNGEIYEAELNVSPILDENRKILYFVGVERDLSRLRAVEKMKAEFIALASHQLRTPLSAVKWFGRMLASGEAGKLNPTQKDFVEKINESNDKEISLVNSLLNVSRIESGKIVVTARPTDLVNLIDVVMMDLRGEAQKGHVKISAVVDNRIPEIMIDGDLVRHVFINVISNAIRYTSGGGKILVKVYKDKGMVMTEVKDSGIGIPKQEQKRIFEKFFRASNALKKETEGNGLGLYLAKTIVESSGGKIGFRSVEGKGSTFWFTLPMKRER
jgi:PAS domain S-box-containing protein